MKKEICDFCGREAKLQLFGQARICSICKLSQNKKLKGKVIYERTPSRTRGKTVYGPNLERFIK